MDNLQTASTFNKSEHMALSILQTEIPPKILAHAVGCFRNREILEKNDAIRFGWICPFNFVS